MLRANNNRRNRNYQVKKLGIKDENIDRQILAIHRAMVDKILLDKSLVPQVMETLERRRETGRMGYGEYITWLSLLENIEDGDFFRQGVLEESDKMRKYRRKTPLVGLLTESERQQALEQEALGILPDSSWSTVF